MILYEKEIELSSCLFNELASSVKNKLESDECPVRFVVTESKSDSYKCELGILKTSHDISDNIFEFHKRQNEDVNQFNAVLLVPTGIGAEIGGHSGDAGPVARLIASACDNLITHPNVVNASDINEMPDNSLYVEGSIITRLLMGTIGLQKVRANKVLLVIDKHIDRFFYEGAINSLSAARAALGLNSPEVLMIEDNVLMRAMYSKSGRAVGRIEKFENLVSALRDYDKEFDAIALSSVINVPKNYHADYFKHDDMLNPWGGVEAMLTHAISMIFNLPSAHSPMDESKELLNLDLGVVDPRKAAEAVSMTFLHSILKGLHKSPKIMTDISLFNQSNILCASDISCLIIPEGCIGLPILAAIEQGIPVIAVKENKNRMKNDLRLLPFKLDKLIIVQNYFEAVGVMNAIKTGISLDTIRRPMDYTKVKEVKAAEEDLKVKEDTTTI